MARQVFPNAMLRHVYAQQSQKSGRNSKDTALFEGPVFYSYSTPVAVIVEDTTGAKVALLSSVTYSSTTSQHIPGARDFGEGFTCFSVPFLPGQSGGRYVEPRLSGEESAAALAEAASDHWRAQSESIARAKARKAHLGNLAHLVARAMEPAERMIRSARRIGRMSSWNEEAATLEHFTDPDSERGYAVKAERARDYARRFGLPVPGESVLPADGGFSRYQEALAAWQAREADPRTARKREASRRQREARAAWMEATAWPILRAAGLTDSRWCREDVKLALHKVPATEAGAAMLRDRLAERRARFEREEAERAEAERQREAARQRMLAEEAANAAAAGFTLEEWRAMWRDYAAAEYENQERDRLARVPADRAKWRAGGWPDGDYRGAEWQRCEAGGDMLRIKPGRPDILETPRGAEVPLAHARRVWRHVLAVMCSEGGSWSGYIRCGHFVVTDVRAGWMTAGCHRFNRAEMLRIAAEIGEPVTCEQAAAFPALETEESAA